MRTTAAGSYPKIPNRPRPARLRQAIARRDRGDITAEELARVEDEVTIEVIAEQAEAGLDLVTDGQIRWDDDQTYIAQRLQGLEITGLIRYFDTNTYYRQPNVTAPVGWRQPILVRDYEFAADHSTKPVKALITGPTRSLPSPPIRTTATGARWCSPSRRRSTRRRRPWQRPARPSSR